VDESFTLVPFQPGDLPPERALRIVADFFQAIHLPVNGPPGLMELGQWRSYGWRIPRLWRLGWGPSHWPRSIEIMINALSGELYWYENEDLDDYFYQASRRGDPPQVDERRALELAQYYLKASGGLSVPMVFDGVYVSVSSEFLVAQGPRMVWKKEWYWGAGWTRVTQGVPWVLEKATMGICPYTGRLLRLDKMYWSPDPTNRVFADAATAVRLATHHLRGQGFPDPGPALYAQLVVVHPDNTAGTLPQFAREVCPEARLAWEVAFPYTHPDGRVTAARFYVDAEEGLVIGGGIPAAGGLQPQKRRKGPRGAVSGEVLTRARRDLARLREVEVQHWTLEGARVRPRLIASLRLPATDAGWRRLLAAVQRSRPAGAATRGLPSWRFVFHRADGTFFRGAYCPADGRLQLEDYPEPGSLVILWPSREFERSLIALPYPLKPEIHLRP
jgi:hypothetical protein